MGAYIIYYYYHYKSRPTRGGSGRWAPGVTAGSSTERREIDESDSCWCVWERDRVTEREPGRNRDRWRERG